MQPGNKYVVFYKKQEINCEMTRKSPEKVKDMS